MISNYKWGPITWELIHSILDINISNEQFKIIKNNLYNLIKNICITCLIQSSGFLFINFFTKINLEKMISIIQMRNVFFLFHNFINSKINKPLFSYNKLSIYSHKNINRVFQAYNDIYFDKNVLGIRLYDPNRIASQHIKMFISKNNMFFDNLFIINVSHTDVTDIPLITDVTDVTDIPLITDITDVTDIPLITDITDVTDVTDITDINPDVNPCIIKNVIKNNTDKYSIYKNISVIDDLFLPSFDLSLPEAMIELKKNPNCIPFHVYLERWKYFSNKKTPIQKSAIKEIPKINIDLLPELTLTSEIALQKIQSNPSCVPLELYFKKWNELKLLDKHKFRK